MLRMNKVKELKVLVADDNERFRKIIGQFLAMQKEIKTVQEAIDGIDAVNKVKSFDPDLLLMDVQMPNMNGFDAFQEIKKETSIPVIFISIFDSNGFKTKSQELGADAYIEKKNIVENLLPAIRDIFPDL